MRRIALCLLLAAIPGSAQDNKPIRGFNTCSMPQECIPATA